MIVGFGMVLNQNWIAAIILFVLAWFCLITFSGVEIDKETRTFRAYTSYFGFLKTGKWKPIDEYVGLTLVPMKKVFTMYSRSNRRNSSFENDFRIYLVNRSKKPAIVVKICKTREQAQTSIDEFSIWLKMPVYSVKK